MSACRPDWAATLSDMRRALHRRGGGAGLKNGALLRQAVAAGFEVFLTVD